MRVPPSLQNYYKGTPKPQNPIVLFCAALQIKKGKEDPDYSDLRYAGPGEEVTRFR